MKNKINEAYEAVEKDYFDLEKEEKSSKRKIVVPGEIIAHGEDYLPGEGTRREGADILACKFGFAEIAGRVVRIIPIFGAFIPRGNNVVIGRVTDITYAGWLVDIDSSSSAFLPIEEAPRYIKRNEMDQYLSIGDVLASKIFAVKGRGIDLTLKGRGLGKLEKGFIFKIIPSRVPRIIGREGSMISLIKEKTKCDITVGQNGWIWIRGPNIETEIKARKAIEMVAENVHIDGLTEKIEEWLAENKYEK